MTDSYVQVAAGQSGDKLRTSLKIVNALEVHEQYVVADVPWTVYGSYFWSASFAGSTSAGAALAAILHPVSSDRDIALRSLSVGYFNEGASAANYVYLQRTLALPGANVADSISNIGFKQTQDLVGTAIPAPTALMYIKPTGVVLGSEPRRQVLSKPSTASDSNVQVLTWTEDEPFVLTSGDALAIVQTAAGTTTETWQIAVEWQECAF